MAKQITIFAAPLRFVPREPMADDGSFQAMATFKVLPNNRLELVEIEGYELGKAQQVQSRTPRSVAAAPQEPLPAGAPGAAPVGAVPAAGAPTPAQPGFAAALVQRFRTATGR